MSDTIHACIDCGQTDQTKFSTRRKNRCTMCRYLKESYIGGSTPENRAIYLKRRAERNQSVAAKANAAKRGRRLGTAYTKLSDADLHGIMGRSGRRYGKF